MKHAGVTNYRMVINQLVVILTGLGTDEVQREAEDDVADVSIRYVTPTEIPLGHDQVMVEVHVEEASRVVTDAAGEFLLLVLALCLTSLDRLLTMLRPSRYQTLAPSCNEVAVVLHRLCVSFEPILVSILKVGSATFHFADQSLV